jgi:hypothetical protein
MEPITTLIVGTTGGYGMSLFGRHRAKVNMARAEAELRDAALVEQSIYAGRDAMLSEGRMVLCHAYLAAEYFGVPLTLYREALSALPEVQPPPALAQKLAQIPALHFDYARPDIEPLAAFFHHPLPTYEGAAVVKGTTDALRHGHPNLAAFAWGVNLARKGMAAWTAASEYRAKVRNYCAEVTRAEHSCREAFARDARALRQTVELLLDCLDGGYQGVSAIAARGAPWEALPATDRLTLENHYFPMAQIHMLCRLPAFRVFEETAA